MVRELEDVLTFDLFHMPEVLKQEPAVALEHLAVSGPTRTACYLKFMELKALLWNVLVLD